MVVDAFLYEKLNTPCFSRLMHDVFESMLNGLCLQVLAPLRGGPFARFRDIVIQDGTSFALHDGLAGAFKGRFTTLNPAAIELQGVRGGQQPGHGARARGRRAFQQLQGVVPGRRRVSLYNAVPLEAAQKLAELMTKLMKANPK